MSLVPASSDAASGYSIVHHLLPSYLPLYMCSGNISPKSFRNSTNSLNAFIICLLVNVPPRGYA